jgi:hypothetical protein
MADLIGTKRNFDREGLSQLSHEIDLVRFAHQRELIIVERSEVFAAGDGLQPEAIWRFSLRLALGGSTERYHLRP